MKKLMCFIFAITTFMLNAYAANTSNEIPVKPFPPFRIVGNLYYVGTNDLANYLLVTSKGNILINSDYESSLPLIKTSIEKLGFKYSDTKILLISHAHADHAAGSALIKKETGAKYMVMDADVSEIESGGKTDFQYGHDLGFLYQPTKVDRILHDGDQVRLGDTALVAHLTAGHSKGCTTWTMQIKDKNKIYNVVIIGSPFVNPGYKLINNKSYPIIAKDYEHMFQVLKSLPCDIYLGAHGGYFGLKEKFARMKAGESNAFVDPEGYKKFVAKSAQSFYSEYEKQKTL